jgi:hypothetical protein
MRLLSCKLAALSLAIFLTAPPAQAGDTSRDACVANSASSLDALASGDFAGAGTHFSATLGKQLDAAKLKQAWAQLQASAGVYGGHAASARQMLQSESVVVTPIIFARTPLDLVTACDAQGGLAHYRFLPASMVKPAEPMAAHVEADGVRVSPLDVPTPVGPLHGALTLPAGRGPFPAVVLVAGSGAHDMDESVGPNKPFRDIAEGLARAGIASLRYDKRPFDYPQGWGGKGSPVIDAEVTDDAVAAVRLLAAQKEVDPRRVFVLGHSLGAMMAPRIGKRAPQLAGLILMAAPTRPLLDVLAQQIHDQNLGGPDKVARRTIEAFRKEQHLLAQAKPGLPPQGTFMQQPQSYWLSLHEYQQVAVAKTLSMPMLFMQGDADFQVSPTLDFAQWKQDLAGRPNATFHLYPGLSHLFMPANQTGDDYSKLGHVDPHVIGDIANWIRR